MNQTLRLTEAEALLQSLLANAEGPAAEALREKIGSLDFTPDAPRRERPAAPRGFSSKAVAAKRGEA
jgi:hypothetical protein